MKTGEVIGWLDATFKPEYQEDYDNSGFLLGNSQSDYRGALVALDLTPEVVDEAVALGMSLIVTHHPFIFTGVKRLTDASETGRMVMALVKNDISVYAAHTNLDNLPWGVSGALAERLGVRECEVLSVKCEVGDMAVGAGMVGELPEPMNVEDFLAKVKTVLGLPIVRVAPLLTKPVSSEQCSVFSDAAAPDQLNTEHSTLNTVKRVALCGGSGAEFIDDAMRAGADIYLTGDLKYHDFQRTDGRMVLADIGHYESEQFAKEIIFRAISEKFSTFACRISDVQYSIVAYI